MKKKKQPRSYFKDFKTSKEAKVGFVERVRGIVRRIPRGKTMTYKEVAAKAGNPRAARAVGMIMSKNYDPKIPCHRVVRSDGKIGNYNRGGPAKKFELLYQEKFA